MMTSAVDPRTSGAIHLPAGQGPTVWFGDAIYTFKASGQATNGALTFTEASEPPGGGPPPHIHEATDEAFYVMSGQLEFLSGEETFLAGDGAFVFIPRGTRHRFRNVGLHAARLLFLFIPGGMEEFFSEIGMAAQPGRAPEPMTPAQRQLIGEVAPRYDVHIAP
jgi:mannose-6-phosphate isomerase-like protein (cupin superfamily)